MNRLFYPALGTLFFGMLSLPTYAKVSPEQAARLDNELTPFGAIRGGDSSLGIPGWTGGLSKAPAGFAGSGNFEVDPYSEQRPLITIDINNKNNYSQYLSDGVQALLAAYPGSFRIPVFKTERSFAAPADIYKNTRVNAINAELDHGGDGFINAYGGIPFPIPGNGLEVIWNHIARWQGRYFDEVSSTAQVLPNGDFSSYRERNQLLSNYYATNQSASSLENILHRYMNQVLPPSRNAGETLLVHETINQVQAPRMAWNYFPGQRRVRRAPTVAYDNPVDGYVSDDADMYNGAPNRYEWKLIGLKPFYVPYNNYRLNQRGLDFGDILKKGHINPDLTRWEMHRVWVVEATLKPGDRHVYQKRRFYLDEDSWNILIAENYDSRGQLWRVNLAFTQQAYEVPTMTTDMIVYHDLISRDYTALGLRSQEKSPRQFPSSPPADSYWQPASLRRIGTN
ncbi:DUF1329 domain-containing protein [Pseudomonas sp. KCJK9016]|uniref:DUF1329 domain-containing protein n=1 Tax=Pseudomonas sp. KCJK9016 TaxID=3344556 RepID=UPI0039062862